MVTLSCAENAVECNEWVQLLRKSVTSARRLSSQVSTKRKLQVSEVLMKNQKASMNFSSFLGTFPGAYGIDHLQAIFGISNSFQFYAEYRAVRGSAS